MEPGCGKLVGLYPVLFRTLKNSVNVRWMTSSESAGFRTNWSKNSFVVPNRSNRYSEVAKTFLRVIRFPIQSWTANLYKL
jgi:hypothetical protein